MAILPIYIPRYVLSPLNRTVPIDSITGIVAEGGASVSFVNRSMTLVSSEGSGIC